MKLFFHGIIAFSGIALAYCGVVIACPALTRDLGLDVWNWPAEQRELEKSRRQSEELSRIREQVLQRIQLKRLITSNLIAGHSTLASAAEDFQALNLIAPEITTATHQTFRGQSMEESTALQVVTCVETAFDIDTCQQREVLERLGKEFRDLFGRKLELSVRRH